jgi:hypothetical protein
MVKENGVDAMLSSGIITIHICIPLLALKHWQSIST